ncbi:MAG: SRPBCC domain-containing protein [Myxococcales bacterium]
MYRTDSEILVDAPPQAVWDVICDLDRYPEWNRFTPRITLATKDLKVGAELDLDCQMTETSLLRDEREVILAVEPERRAFCMGTSRTRGRPGIKSFRWQICEEAGAGRTRLVNFEQFHGPLAPIVHFLYAKKLKKAFERYCRDLKSRVESLQAKQPKAGAA